MVREWLSLSNDRNVESHGLVMVKVLLWKVEQLRDGWDSV